MGVMESNHNPSPDARSIIAKWPDVRTMAADAGCEPVAVHRWRTRNSIPAGRFTALMVGASRRGISLSYEDLAASRSSGFISEIQTPRATSHARGKAADVSSRTPAATKSPV